MTINPFLRTGALFVERLLISAFFLTCIVLGIAFYVRTGQAERSAQATLETTALHLEIIAKVKANQVLEEVHGLRTDFQSSENALAFALGQYGGLAQDIRNKIPVLQEFGDRKVAELTVAAGIEAGTINGRVGQVADSVTALQVSVSKPLSQISEQIEFYDNCDASDPEAAGQDCLFNRYQGTANSIEKTLFQVAKAAPEFSGYVLGISGDSKKIADSVQKSVAELTRPRTAKEKLANLFYGAAPTAVRILAFFF
jgi:hypothetical protein